MWAAQAEFTINEANTHLQRHPHQALGVKTPAEAHALASDLSSKCWGIQSRAHCPVGYRSFYLFPRNELLFQAAICLSQQSKIESDFRVDQANRRKFASGLRLRHCTSLGMARKDRIRHQEGCECWLISSGPGQHGEPPGIQVPPRIHGTW